MKGWRTIAVMTAGLFTYLLAWPELKTLVSPQYIAAATAAVGIVLRLLTDTPVGQKGGE